ncbi:hypothetical protein JK636_00890 [Clostridium sp. YIM B02515]|uniref:GntR family transcriptional regulator n=1 Tax=Clostridium rhizosphaerae TaxID=2803861 RepID=A0ABS1T4P4_9CLOT|nr:GntR family transcriptional regulator YhfZ [Clostridium rhizosphaerae]MBL4934307.1 hypothetical protein [Clostridium rhizosphaerae]
MNSDVKLMQKSGMVTINIAKELLTLKEGDRIGTVRDYSEKFEVARGTVQAAIKLLEKSRAIGLEPRGHLGTFITSIDYEKLCEFADIGTIMGVMPLPYSKLYEGLATGLYKSVEDKKISFGLAYMRGAETRLRALEKGRYDFAIVSKLAALQGVKENINLEVAMKFGKYSYVNEHVIAFGDSSKKLIEDGMKVGIDKSSIDHYILTLNQCIGKNIQLVEMPYNQIISKLLNREIDAAVWNLDEIIERKINIKYCPLNENNYEKNDTEAVLVVCSGNELITKILKQFISDAKVINYQRQVIKGEIIPNY